MNITIKSLRKIIKEELESAISNIYGSGEAKVSQISIDEDFDNFFDTGIDDYFMAPIIINGVISKDGKSTKISVATNLVIVPTIEKKYGEFESNISVYEVPEIDSLYDNPKFSPKANWNPGFIEAMAKEEGMDDNIDKFIDYCFAQYGGSEYANEINNVMESAKQYFSDDYGPLKDWFNEKASDINDSEELSRDPEGYYGVRGQFSPRR